MAPPRVQYGVSWLLAGQLVVDLVLVGLLGFVAWRARALLHALTNLVVGTGGRPTSFSQAFGSIAVSADLSANAAAATAVAVQTLTRDLRPVAHGQTDDQLHTTIDLGRLSEPERINGGQAAEDQPLAVT